MTLWQKLGIERAWLTNMDWRPDRLQRSTEVLRGVSIEPVRLAGIDAAAMGLLPKSSRVSSQKHLGAYLTHWLACRMASEQGIGCYAVFEDDVILCPDFARHAAAFADEVPPDWDFLWLGAYEVSRQRRRILSPHVALHDRLFGAHAYAVRGAGIGKVYQALSVIDESADLQLSRLTRTWPTCYAARPALFLQDYLDSDVRGDRNRDWIAGVHRWAAAEGLDVNAV